jgi:hypothetical protein
MGMPVAGLLSITFKTITVCQNPKYLPKFGETSASRIACNRINHSGMTFKGMIYHGVICRIN